MAQPDKHRKILRAAVHVFARNGFYNSKVAQIAREAGVADGTIYLYFKNKEDILVQVFVDTMERAVALQESVLQGFNEPAAQLRAFITEHFRAVTSDEALAEVVTVELRQSSKFMRATDMKPFGRYLGILARIIRTGQAQGVFAARLQPRIVARTLFGALDELALEWSMASRRPPVDALAAHTVDLFLHGLVPRPEDSLSPSFHPEEAGPGAAPGGSSGREPT